MGRAMGAPRLQGGKLPGRLPIQPGGRLRLWTRIQRRVVQTLLPQQPRGWRTAPPRRSATARAAAFGSLGLCLLAVLLMIVGLVAGDEPATQRPAADVARRPAEKPARARPAEASRRRSGRRHERKQRKRPGAAAAASSSYAGSAGATRRPAAARSPRANTIRRDSGGDRKPPPDRTSDAPQPSPPEGSPTTTPAPTAPPPTPAAPPESTAPPSAPAGDGGGPGNGNGPGGNGPPGQAGP